MASKTRSLSDLDEALFAELDRLGRDIAGEELQAELSRANGVAALAKQIISTRRLALDAARFREETALPSAELPEGLRQ